jgi:galactose-1-phosphate uridylyltransferase
LTIRFDSTLRQAHILNPLKNFKHEIQTIDHRRDPLTGRSVIVLKGRMDYVKRFIESDAAFIEELFKSTEANCPFCPSALEKAPKFIPEIDPEGRIQVGQAICFPSLFAHQDFNAIVVPTPSHRLQLNEFSPSTLFNALKACLRYLEKVRASQPKVRYATIVMNYLPPAGSTIAHPHLQVLASDIPFASVSMLLEASKVYFQTYGSNYWLDLIETERRLKERYAGSVGSVHWLTPYAPRGLNEVEAIVPGKSSLDQLSDEDVSGLAEGAFRVLRFYYDIGVRSFNAVFYSAPLGERIDYFNLGFHMVSRYGYKPRFVSDVWSLQYLLSEQEVYESPEETCSKLRKYFE